MPGLFLLTVYWLISFLLRSCLVKQIMFFTTCVFSYIHIHAYIPLIIYLLPRLFKLILYLCSYQRKHYINKSLSLSLSLLFSELRALLLKYLINYLACINFLSSLIFSSIFSLLSLFYNYIYYISNVSHRIYSAFKQLEIRYVYTYICIIYKYIYIYTYFVGGTLLFILLTFSFIIFACARGSNTFHYDMLYIMVFIVLLVCFKFYYIFFFIFSFLTSCRSRTFRSREGKSVSGRRRRRCR